MKDLRPPTLQTYTDKTYKYINSRHIYTQGISYPCTHIAPNTWHTGIHTHTHTIRYTRILAKDDCAILKQSGNKSTLFDCPCIHLTAHRIQLPRRWNMNSCLLEREGPPRALFSNIVGLKGKLERINPVLNGEIPSFCPTVSLGTSSTHWRNIVQWFPCNIYCWERCVIGYCWNRFLYSFSYHPSPGRTCGKLGSRVPFLSQTNCPYGERGWGSVAFFGAFALRSTIT